MKGSGVKRLFVMLIYIQYNFEKPHMSESQAAFLGLADLPPFSRKSSTSRGCIPG